MKEALIVGDAPIEEPEIEALLQKLGYRMVKLDVAGELGPHFTEKRYQLAVLNRALPGMSLHESIREIKSIAPDTAVMTLSQTATQEDIRDAVSAGSYVVLDRPLSEESLAVLISRSSEGLFLVLRG